MKYDNLWSIFHFFQSILTEKTFEVEVRIIDVINANIHHHKNQLGFHIIGSNIKETGRPFAKKYQTAWAIAKQPVIIPNSFLSLTILDNILNSGKISRIGLMNRINIKIFNANSQKYGNIDGFNKTTSHNKGNIVSIIFIILKIFILYIC